MVGKLVEILEEKHGGKLDLKNGNMHYLFLKDGLFSVYLEEDTNTIKADVEFLPVDKTFVYHSDETLEELLK